MPELVFNGQLPSSNEFREALAQANATTNPIDDLLDLADQLRGDEQKYHMLSSDFYQRYQGVTA